MHRSDPAKINTRIRVSSYYRSMKLSGISDLTLTFSQQKFLIETTEELLERNPEECFKEHQLRLREELEQVFKEL